MVLKLTTADLVALLALATLSVVWSGLNWPPPLWIVGYGLPGSQGPTGRVAMIDGVEFVEFPAGYRRVAGPFVFVEESPLPDRLARNLFPAVSGPLIGMGTCRDVPLWEEFPTAAWITRDMAMETCARIEGRGRSVGWPVRRATWPETAVAVPGMGPHRLEPLRLLRMSDARLAFSITPDQEHLVEPYLVEGK